MDKQEITIRSHLDSHVFSDFSNFNAFQLHNRWLSLAAFPELMLALSLVHYFTDNLFFFKLFLVLGFILPIGYLFFYFVSLRRQIQVNQLTTPRLAYTVTLSYSGIHVATETEQITYRWDQIYRVYVRNNATYVYITRARAFLLPNSDLPSGTSQNALVALIHRYLNPIRMFDKRSSHLKKRGDVHEAI